jgi:hypothetical protein
MARKLMIEIGTRVAKVDQPRRVYTVTAVDERPGQPPHARIAPMESPREEITISVSALTDPTLFKHMK